MEKRPWLRQALPAAVLALGAAALWPFRHLLTAEAVSRFSPRQAWLAAAFLLALYAVKSLSVCFPMSALTAAGGLLFPYPAALAVNLAGTALAQSLPFLMGRRSRGGLEALLEKHPRLAAALADGRRDEGLLVFLLRLAGTPPGDLVSLSLGAAGIPFSHYLPPGLLGAAPRVAAATLLGASLWDPWSGPFWAAVGLNAAVTVCSLAIWRIRRR